MTVLRLLDLKQNKTKSKQNRNKNNFFSNWVLFIIIWQNTPFFFFFVILAPSSLMKTHRWLYQFLRNSTPKGRHIYVYQVGTSPPPLPGCHQNEESVIGLVSTLLLYTNQLIPCKGKLWLISLLQNTGKNTLVLDRGFRLSFSLFCTS